MLFNRWEKRGFSASCDGAEKLFALKTTISCSSFSSFCLVVRRKCLIKSFDILLFGREKFIFIATCYTTWFRQRGDKNVGLCEVCRTAGMLLCALPFPKNRLRRFCERGNLQWFPRQASPAGYSECKRRTFDMLHWVSSLKACTHNTPELRSTV